MTGAEDRRKSMGPSAPTFEESDIYKLLVKATEQSIHEAHDLIGSYSKTEINSKSATSGNSFLHLLVQVCSDLGRKNLSRECVIPVLYRTVTRGIDVNTRNKAGNTALHLSCVRPHAEILWEHLIRVGVDPTLPNLHNCTVIHNYEGRTCYQIKDQLDAKTGIWAAVEREDYATVELYLKSWVRSQVRRNNRSLRELCDGTGNTRVKSLLIKYEWINELVVAAMACDSTLVFKLIKDHFLNPNIADESYTVPKPLLVAVEELGDISKSTVDTLRQFGVSNDETYIADLRIQKELFEQSTLYSLIKECSRSSLTQALELLDQKASQVNLKLSSYSAGTEGWTYLHLIVNAYKSTEDVVCRRILVRCIYKLALLGINVNAKDTLGNTSLIHSFDLNDQILSKHLISIGVDPSLSTASGSCLSLEAYLHKGRLTMMPKCKRKDVPGIWVGAEDNDIGKVRRWLQSYSRVKCTKNGRSIKDVSKAKRFQEVVKLLEEYEHTNEFVMATFACDLYRMKMLSALGKRLCNVNPVDSYYLAGFKQDLSGEYVPRPLIIPAIEYCTAAVVDFLINYGANLSDHYEECAPCGPVAFWAFKDDIDSEVTLVVSKYADVNLRDELGHTLLHKASLRKPDQLKLEIMTTLLDRKINIGARDEAGFTARDYLTAIGGEVNQKLVALIDQYVVYKVTNDEYYSVETLIIQSYDHLLDIYGHQRKKEARMLPARDLAYLSNLQEMVELLDSSTLITEKMNRLQEAARTADVTYISKHLGEKRLLHCQDRYGRSLMHLAVLYGHPDMVKFLIDQVPDLVKSRDNVQRTPLHYAAASTIRRLVYGLMINQAGADQQSVDANNLSVQEYMKEIEHPTQRKYKLRGKQYYDYQVPKLIEKMLEKDQKDKESEPQPDLTRPYQ